MHSLVVLAIGVAENLDPTPDEYTGNGDADGQVRLVGAQPPNESSGNEDAAIRGEIVPAERIRGADLDVGIVYPVQKPDADHVHVGPQSLTSRSSNLLHSASFHS
jgi:hypothetical protein